MRPIRTLVRFVCLFGVLYGLLIAPWPGWNSRYSQAFCYSCERLLGAEGADRIVRFERAPEGARLDTQIVLADPRQLAPDGMVKARVLGLDSRGVGWVPTALFSALVLATPVGWKRRLRSLAAGLLLMQAFIVLSVLAYIWNESLPATGPGASLVGTLTKRIAEGLQLTLVTQIGASFAVPAILWLLVCFDRRDIEAAQRILGERRDP